MPATLRALGFVLHSTFGHPCFLRPLRHQADTTARYINRELSWLEFNQGVLDEARDPTVPLLERLKDFWRFSAQQPR